MRVAAIDVGSNSIHMVIAEVESDGHFRVLDRVKEMVRLGRRTLRDGRLSAAAIRAGIATLRGFQTLALRHGVSRFQVVATSAVREAANGGDFIRLANNRLGIRIKVIPGSEEARLIYLGVQHAFDLRGETSLIVDIGGGSVELILVEKGHALRMHSAKLGVARLADLFLHSDPPGSKSLARLEAHVQEELSPFLDAVCASHSVQRIIGTSGTMLNLVAMAAHLTGVHPPVNLNHFSVPAREIHRLRRRLVKMNREERLLMKGLDAKRVDLIVPGAYLADYVCRRTGATSLVACTWALREGVLLDFIARHRKGIEEAERFPNVRQRSVARFARHLGETGPHGAHVAFLALQLYDQIAPGLALPAEAREWLEYAARLHDVGHHLSHTNHHLHSYYLIRNGELLGFRQEEIEVIAQVARYHQKSPPRITDEEFQALAPKLRRTVRVLSALLRIADALDRSHYGVVRSVRVLGRDRRRTIRLCTGGNDAALEVWKARRRAGLFEDVLDVKLAFSIARPLNSEKRTVKEKRRAGKAASMIHARSIA